MDWHCFVAKTSCVKSYLGCSSPAVLLDPVGSRLRHETLWIHFQTFEYNLLSVSEEQLKTANRCIVVRVFPPPEENIGFMNKYGILSRGSGNSYLQHSINSNLISAKTSTSGKFAILFNREMAILKFLFAIADFKCAIFGTWSSFYMMPLAGSQFLFLVKVSLGTWDLLSDVVLSHWVGDCQKFFFHPGVNWSSCGISWLNQHFVIWPYLAYFSV